jgi:hypothetical protein
LTGFATVPENASVLKRAVVLCVLPLMALAACEEEDDYAQKPLGTDETGGGDWTDEGEDPCGGESSEVECNVWDQDCPPGQKCVVWGEQEDIPVDERRPENAKCVAVVCDAKEPGEECRAQGGFLNGVDNCDKTSQCWVRDFQDDQNENGICVPFCGGDSGVGSRLCHDPGNRACVVFWGYEWFGLCMPRCDPLVQACDELLMEGHTCLPNDEEVFACYIHVVNSQGSVGDSCDFYNGCDPGLVCAEGSELAGCDSGLLGCCTPFCDTTEANSCPGAANGEECVDVWADPLNPDAGVCSLPP